MPESAGANEPKGGAAMRWTGSPKVENAGCSRVNHFVHADLMLYVIHV